MPSVCCSTLACPLSPKSCGSNCPSSNPSQIPTANSKTTPTGASQTSSSQQASGSDKVSIIVWPYPEMQQSWPNPEAEDQIQTADSILRAVRKLRNDYRNYRLQRQRPELFIQVHLFWECSLFVQSTVHHIRDHMRLCLRGTTNR